MDVAALAVWALTAATGFILLGTWLVGGGLAQQGGGASRIRSPLIFSHFGIAALGLAMWVAFVLTDGGALALFAVVSLPVVAGLGLMMFVLWLGGRGARRDARDVDSPAEQRFPALVVALHGFLAVVTVVLVVLAALRIG